MYWCLGIGLFFILTGVSSIFTDFAAFLGGLIIGGPLLLIGLLIAKKKKPQFFPLIKEKKYGDAIKDLFSKPSIGQVTDDSGCIVDTFHLAGVIYYHANIMKLANLNPQWKLTTAQHLANGKAGRNIYKYNFTNTPVELVPEPKNPHDKNAVSVHIAGQLVGYISQEQNVYVKKLLKGRRIKYISGFIGGGEYKYIAPDGTTAHGDTAISVNIRIGHV